MKKLLTATILLFLFSCKKEMSDKELSEALDQSITATGDASQIPAYHIGDPNRSPNLYIPEAETGWLGYGLMGLRTAYKRMEYGNGVWKLKYDCVIANGEKNATSFIDFDGKQNGQPRDFVVCRPCDGVKDQYETNTYDFPGMLKLTLFSGGKVVGSVLKQQFWVENNRERENFPWANQHYYGMDTMYIFRGAGDNYFNSMPIPSDVYNQPIAGKYALKVEVNPDKVITESDYTDNVSFLPVSINGTNVVTDETALLENKPFAAAWIECKLLRGKVKGVSLKWSNVECENYCIERNGQMIKVWYNGTEYIDLTGTKNDTYRIRSNNWGLGNIYNDYKKVSIK